jgi:DNA-binding ferritin-like protein (Dps family)
MDNFLTRMFEGKREWRAMEARAAALPTDYRIVYDEIKGYLWRFTAGDGMDIVEILKDLLGLFETGAADGRRALQVTGEDVGAFCDELLRNARTYTENWRTTLNTKIAERLQKEGLSDD